MKISDLLQKFNLKLNLPKPLLDLEIEGKYDVMNQDNMVFKFINEKGDMDYNYFDCYIFKSKEHILAIVPDNNFEVVIYRKLLDSGIAIGYSYDALGNLSSRT